MQCPICKKDLEIKNKKVGENEAGEAIYNEFAICRDCKKQWNLDKQREKKKKIAEEALAKKIAENKASEGTIEKPSKKRPASEGERTSTEHPSQPKKKKKRPVSPETADKAVSSSADPEAPARPKKKRPRPASEGERPVRKPRPQADVSSEEPSAKLHQKKRPEDAERPLLKYAEKQESDTEAVRPRPKKKRPEADSSTYAVDDSKTCVIADEEDDLKITAPDLDTDEEKVQTYSNIPPKHVREKREQEMRENYQNMLDEEDEGEERHFPVVLVVILIFLIIAAAAFAGYWFFLR